MKKFVRLLKESFKEQLRSYRELLWSSRIFFAGVISAKEWEAFDKYANGEIGLSNLIFLIVFGILFLLFPFAYGIDPLKEEKNDEEV